MHDPYTVAHEIKYPWRQKPSSLWPEGYRSTFITIWHKDPEKDHTDDSCGWFPRSRHGDSRVLTRIENRFKDDWDRVFTSEGSGKSYFCGYFCPNGEPNLSVQGIALNFFFLAAYEHFGSREKASEFCQKHLFEMMLFSENPTDSLSDSLTMKFGNDVKREERIRNIASCIYGWILRATRPWYKHPRWHIHHWRLQVHPWDYVKRGLFDRCSKCKKGFRFGEVAMSSWSGGTIWHENCNDRSKKSSQAKQA